MDNELVKIEQEVNSLTAKITQLKQEIGKIIIGQEETVEQLLITFWRAVMHCLKVFPDLPKP